ncbi:glycogen synthase [Striga asiatica]|uniref:Glycogen synthase n=1 Tax=Striga asiatica TaxID=4170 RepID=A0A5A7PA09_STRAF|nr:glycogen synthase [Striga asiatica]
MATTANPSYQRLKHESWFDHEQEDHRYYNGFLEKVVRRSRSSRLGKKFRIRRKLRVKSPSLRRFVRRKTRVVKFAWRKVYERLKESRSHFGDLFAGNYLFMQVAM